MPRCAAPRCAAHAALCQAALAVLRLGLAQRFRGGGASVLWDRAAPECRALPPPPLPRQATTRR